jgi:hypothetical protein
VNRVLVGVVLGVMSIGSLAGCATGAGGAESSTATVPEGATPTPTPSPSVDIEAQARAQSWVDDAVLPPGAVRSDTAPPTTAGWGTEMYGWWCSPMELREAYWTVPDTTLVEAATWLSDNPTSDLMVPIPFRVTPIRSPP